MPASATARLYRAAEAIRLHERVASEDSDLIADGLEQIAEGEIDGPALSD